MDRRDLFRYVLIASGSAIALRLATAMDGPSPTGREGQDLMTFTDPERRSLTAAVDLIIPRTDTAGAVEAGVPQFIESITRGWFTPEERAVFVKGLRELDESARGRFGSAFGGCSASQQTLLLEELEAAALGARALRSEDVLSLDIKAIPFFHQLKELTVLGYYTSERGGTEELRYNPVPGGFDGDVDFSSLGHQWTS